MAGATTAVLPASATLQLSATAAVDARAAATQRGGAPPAAPTKIDSDGAAAAATRPRAGPTAVHGVLLVVAVTFMSSAATVFALLGAVAPLLMASWRLWATAAAQTLPFVWQWRRAPAATRARWRRGLPALVASGVALGVHFGSWIWSITLTSVARACTHACRSIPRLAMRAAAPPRCRPDAWLTAWRGCADSLLAVSAHPLVFVALLWGAHLWRPRKHRAPTRLETVGAVVGFGGGAVMTLDAADDDSVTVGGDAVAFLGAVAMVAYLSAGRSFRSASPSGGEAMPLFLYAWPVTAVSAVVCSVASVAVGEGSVWSGDADTGELAPAESRWLFGWVTLADGGRFLGYTLYLACGPGLAGHTLINHLLHVFQPLSVSVVLLLEAIPGSLIAWLAGVQGAPGLWTWIGGPLLLAGAALCVIGADAAEEPADGTGSAVARAGAADRGAEEPS